MAELIVALDLPSGDEAVQLLDRLPAARWVKVGSVLFTREGPALIEELVQERGLHVFLDLKWHDIPNTVAGAVEAAAGLGVALATVHALGGEPMMRAAVDAARGRLRLVGVTVLTSHDAPSLQAVMGREVGNLGLEVSRLTRLAAHSGLDGVVCSPHEVERVRQLLGPDPWIVVPGIRRPEDAAGDQRRTAGPAEAVRAGATHLVVGRPLVQASDPAAVFTELMEAMA
ncbi:MAG: orotidine-5'-phosphate decarboxylase [Gemmatimonadota bacterium]